MFVSPDTKFEGEHYDDELGLFLDVPAEVQSYPLWWRDNPRAYALLQERRKALGIKVKDTLDIGPDDLGDLLSNEDIMKEFESGDE